MVNKIPRELDNPFDNICNDLSEYMSELFYQANFTPNGLTTCSLIFGVASIYFLSKNDLQLFFVCWIIAYFFDCFDGYFARKYSLVSQFGDFYDHAKDTIVGLSLYYFVYTNFKTYPIDLYVLIIITLLTHIHLGCQQYFYKNSEKTDYIPEFLDIFQNICTESLKWTRYFGPGTMNIIIPLYIIYIVNRKLI